ncbi:MULTISPECIES: iron-containing alcohol dehydrogenase [unclassified Francisella]|uniref:iron-containing alcohol dehydrogenase n=1 Tax=unclassified Francisella TaxID=2610885 RepID=UPI002E36074F|nr:MULTISPECIES: iron-containing alcohol dehydrogenase [unclassified Francisella]MED7818875.1 iron-containing alcohol dehydrogenase [Francisella sp. 19S2-4]MED7829670.1 iron-containing alcohol dehydrogenase [Francisella sp. 19S2-10]
MQNFEYYNPVRIFFGKGEIAKLSDAISKDKKILMIYGGGSIKKNGVYQQVKDALVNHHLYEFSGIEPNPEYETCMKAVEYIKENNIDFILAVGGGSVIDATKFISAAVKFDGQPWDILAKGAEVKNAVDFGTVLTIPATGSEMNAGAVISRREINKKLAFMSEKVFPKFSVLDPEVTYTLPARQVANGVVDAFVHVMEQYLTFPQNAPLQDRFAEGILQTLIEEGDKLIDKPNDYNVRANIMWSATMALNSLISRGVAMDWSTHMIGHELTTFYGLDHAQTLAIILPSVMQHKRDKKGDKIAQYAERVWGVPRSVRKDEKIDIAIIKTVEFFERIGNATKLSSYDFGTEHFDKIIKSLETNGMNALGEHQDITLADTRQILEMSL